MCIEVKQNNTRTKKQKVKEMAVYTTNWNLYRTHFKNTINDCSKNSSGKQRLSKKEENELLESLVEQLHDF